jgi:hypothetical protein
MAHCSGKRAGVIGTRKNPVIATAVPSVYIKATLIRCPTAPHSGERAISASLAHPDETLPSYGFK